MHCWYGFWFRIFYILNLRVISIKLQRWLMERKAPRAPLPKFDSVDDILQYLKVRDYTWRRDGFRFLGIFIPLDWPTHPEVFQASLLDHNTEEEDCDGFHLYVATLASEFAEDVALCSTLYPGGGHTACAVKENGEWTFINYYTKTKVDELLDIPQLIASWGSPKKPKVKAYVIEDLDFKPRYIC